MTSEGKPTLDPIPSPLPSGNDQQFAFEVSFPIQNGDFPQLF